jgi:hypothetical protein
MLLAAIEKEQMCMCLMQPKGVCIMQFCMRRM